MPAFGTIPDESAMLELLIVILWACLSYRSVRTNPLTNEKPSSEAILKDLCTTASLSFCPGLYDILHAPAPPDIDFYKSLPNDFHARWGVYALILEKKDHGPLLYIGSGTQAERGIEGRIRCYELLHRSNLPFYVAKALDDGYKIVSKGLIVWCPIPRPKDVPSSDDEDDVRDDDPQDLIYVPSDDEEEESDGEDENLIEEYESSKTNHKARQDWLKRLSELTL